MRCAWALVFALAGDCVFDPKFYRSPHSYVTRDTPAPTARVVAGLREIWLNPAVLAMVRTENGLTRIRYQVLGRFEDGHVGEVSALVAAGPVDKGELIRVSEAAVR
jgi:hypothetical protein